MIELLGMSLDTDPRAFFREFYPRVYRFVWSRTRLGPEDAEEISQEVLLHAWRDRERFRGDSDPVTWVLSIARHRILEHRRKEDRRGRADAVRRALLRIDAEPLPEEILRTGELRARVWRALALVGKEYADLLARRYLEDLSVREIARRAGESEKAVESRLHRAREAFKKALQSGEENDDQP